MSPAKVDIGRGQIVQAFLIALVVVVLDELGHPGFEFSQQVLILYQDAVLERLVPAFDRTVVRESTAPVKLILLRLL